MKYKLSFFLLLALLALIGCKKNYAIIESDSGNANYKQVKVIPMKTLNKPVEIPATGVLASKKIITLTFKTGGIVRSLNADEGDKITMNKILASLDLSEINARLSSATEAFEKSQRDLERVTNLYKDTVATLEQKQNALTAKEVAQNNLEIATFNHDHSIIKSTLNGTILKRFVEQGELVSPGQPIFIIADTGGKNAQIIRVGLADKDIIKIHLGDQAKVSFDAFPDTLFNATVTEMGEQSNPRTGLYEVELALTETNDSLRNGFIAKVVIMPSHTEKTYEIPMDALVEGKDKKASIFFTTNRQTVQKAIVDVVSIQKDYFTVKISELPKDVWLVNEGAPYLKANDSIQILP